MTDPADRGLHPLGRRLAAVAAACLLLTATGRAQVAMTQPVTQVPPGVITALPPGVIVPGTIVPTVVVSQPPSQAIYVLGPEDQISIHVVDSPDISDKPQRIDPNGDLKLPVVGRVKAAGRTIDELERDLTDRLKEFINEPDVTVSVGELRSQSVSVIGAVPNPGVQQIRGRQTIIEILSQAGGIRPEAGPIVRVLRRPEWGQIPLPEATTDPATGSSSVDIDLRKLLDATAPEKNLPLLPNDVVSIPMAELVYVVGEVAKAGAIPLIRGNSITVTEALAASGGVLRTSKASDSRVLRFDPATQTRTEVELDLSKVVRGKAPNLELQAGDILMVPDNTGKRIASATLQGFIAAATSAVTWGLIR